MSRNAFEPHLRLWQSSVCAVSTNYYFFIRLWRDKTFLIKCFCAQFSLDFSLFHSPRTRQTFNFQHVGRSRKSVGFGPDIMTRQQELQSQELQSRRLPTSVFSCTHILCDHTLKSTTYPFPFFLSS